MTYTSLPLKIYNKITYFEKEVSDTWKLKSKILKIPSAYVIPFLCQHSIIIYVNKFKVLQFDF